MTKSLLICTQVSINGYSRRGGQRDAQTKAYTSKGEGVINLKILRKKILVVEWSETTNLKTLFTRRTKIEVPLKHITSAVFGFGKLSVTFAEGSAVSTIGDQPWCPEKQQRVKCIWLKQAIGPLDLAKACLTAGLLSCKLHNTETKIRKDLKLILTPKVKETSPNTGLSDAQHLICQENTAAWDLQQRMDLQQTPEYSPLSSPTTMDNPRKRGSLHLESNEHQSLKKPRSLTHEEATNMLLIPQNVHGERQLGQLMNPNVRIQNMIQNLGHPMYPPAGMPLFNNQLVASLGTPYHPLMANLAPMAPIGTPMGLPIGQTFNNTFGLPPTPANATNHKCVMNTQCQSCAINICGTCSVVAGCGCGPFCNNCFQYTDTCNGCGHTQCEHCVLNSFRGSCDCTSRKELITKFAKQNNVAASAASYNFFADWEY